MPISMPRQRAVATAVIALCTAWILGGCSADEAMSEDDLLERISTATREAPTFQFRYAEGGGSAGTLVTQGAIAYDDDGQVQSLHITSDSEGAIAHEYRLIEGTMFSSADGAQFTETDDDEAASVIAAWDWAAAIDSYDDVESLQERGSGAQIDGSETTEYEVTFADHVEIWTVDTDDQLRHLAIEGHDLPHATLSGYGEDIEVPVPEDVG